LNLSEENAALQDRIAELEDALRRADLATREDGSPPPLPLEHAVVFQAQRQQEKLRESGERISELEACVDTLKVTIGSMLLAAQQDEFTALERCAEVIEGRVRYLERERDEARERIKELDMIVVTTSEQADAAVAERDEARAEVERVREMHARILEANPEPVERAYAVILQLAAERARAGLDAKPVVRAVDALQWYTGKLRAEVDDYRTRMGRLTEIGKVE